MLTFDEYNFGYSSNEKWKLNHKISSNKIVGVIGENGSGKSTFFKSMAGILPHQSGAVFHKDIDISKLNSKEKSNYISYFFALKDIFSELYIEELISIENTKKTAITDEIIAYFQLEKILHKKINRVSDGELQRANLARIFMRNTPITLLDEPTIYLDFKHTVLLKNFILKNKAENNKTVFIASHDFDFLASIADEYLFFFEERKIKYFENSLTNNEINNILGLKD